MNGCRAEGGTLPEPRMEHLNASERDALREILADVEQMDWYGPHDLITVALAEIRRKLAL